MRRILQFNTHYSGGGAAAIARTLHQRLNALPGYESLFAYGRGPESTDPRAVRFALTAEVYLHAALVRLTGLQGYGSWCSTLRLRRLIQTWQPHLVHVHNLHGYVVDLSLARWLGQRRIPVVWTLHDAWALTGRCAHPGECTRWESGCGHCPRMWAYPRALVDSSAWMWSRKRRLLGADWQPWIVTPSHWLARLVRQATGDRLPIRVIPNGVDTERFRPAPDRAQLRERLGFPPTARIILLVAAKLGAAEKGILPLLESLAQASAPEWVVLTVGAPIRLPKSVACRLQVRQLGYLSSPEALAQAYNAADVFCIPSLEDTFPTTVLEAMACGLPVVGFRTGGIPEQLTEETGILVPRGDFRALCHALAQILQDEELQHRMRFHARQHAVQEFSLERFLQRYCSLYEEALQALPTTAVQAPGAAG